MTQETPTQDPKPEETVEAPEAPEAEASEEVVAASAEAPETEPEPEPAVDEVAEVPADEAPIDFAGAVTGRVAELEAQNKELDDKWRRAAAEMENVRRRADIQIEQGRKYAIADFAKAMLGVADNLQRALDHVPEEARANDEAVKALYEGVEMTGKALVQAMEKFGVTPVADQGQRFDPKIHEAMYEVPLPDQPAGMVVQVLEKGYMIADRLLRPARVGVSKGGPKPEAVPTPVDSAADEAPTEGAGAYDKAQDAATRPEAGSQLNEEL
ncbi:nucleotide exchange factor GrpE [Magnetospira sp. QH-2]|uniref:nucleotide exchange factor GrpE n=1 Tax=Magnetospira sp. (strain QH-2) TaxID=1288970 RepID=UPI000698F742|nr:nucleotide exchange factor GrpE [Magnetospira sp. QH-2]